jgi:Holliday junction resolvase-like predicted endonuclease
MVSVIKADGSVEPFDEAKVAASIRRAKIPESLQNEVLTDIKAKIYNNIPTSEIYGSIIDSLGKSDQPYSRGAYSLKQVMMLGPTGYPFEDFVGKILDSAGYKTVVRQLLRGKCVTHEVDVIAEKNGKRIMVEAKFHNNPGTRSDLHVALYTHARFLDLQVKYDLHEAWIVTNTKTTTDAIAYATCVGMNTVSWSYPAENSLRDLIEAKNLRPVTMLTSISSAQKIKLLQHHIVLCKDIENNPGYLNLLNLKTADKNRTVAEVSFICQSNPDQYHPVLAQPSSA